MRQRIVFWLARILVALVLLLLLTFTGDAIAVRTRRPQFGSVQVRVYYAVRMKDGKTSYMYDQPQDETCAHSLFPQLGYRPCWYVERVKAKRIDMQ